MLSPTQCTLTPGGLWIMNHTGQCLCSLRDTTQSLPGVIKPVLYYDIRHIGKICTGSSVDHHSLGKLLGFSTDLVCL
jgi:hypothetical protein